MPNDTADGQTTTPDRPSLAVIASVLLGILLLGGIARFYQLGEVPFGIYSDEALNGTQARDALENTAYRWFYPENYGREGLFINAIAQSIRVFGPTPFALRFISALTGTLLLLGVFLLGRELLSVRVGLIAAFLIASSFWAINFSRVAFRGILLPTVLVFCVYLLIRAIKTRCIGRYIGAGVLCGLLLHTYPAARLAPLVLLALIPWWRSVRTGALVADKGRIVAFLLAALVVAAPLLVHFVANPDAALARTKEVSVFGTQADTGPGFFAGIGLSLAKYFWSGDMRWRHNYPPYAILHPLVSLAFAAGLVLITTGLMRKATPHRAAYGFLGVWFVVMLIPEFLTTEGLPHALRAIGTLPAVYLIAAVPIAALIERASVLAASKRTMLLGVCGLLLASVPAVNLTKYFGYWANDNGTLNDYCAHWRMLAEHLGTLPDDLNKYVILNAGGALAEGDWPIPGHTIRYVTDGRVKNLQYVTGSVAMESPCVIAILLPKEPFMTELRRVFPRGTWRQLSYRADRTCYAYVMNVP